MGALPKLKINLTVDRDILELAKDVAEKRGRSLSSIVEEFLARLAEDATGTDWLEDFHRRYLRPGYVEPSNTRLEKLKKTLQKRHA